MTHTVVWHDAKREPQCPPDPAYPEGKDVGIFDVSPACKVDLPYPAKRCGTYMVECQTCGLRVAVTTAGRPDDPRSVTIPCRTELDLCSRYWPKQ